MENSKEMKKAKSRKRQVREMVLGPHYKGDEVGEIEQLMSLGMGCFGEDDHWIPEDIDEGEVEEEEEDEQEEKGEEEEVELEDDADEEPGTLEQSEQLHLLPKPLSEVKLPVLSLAHHHHIIHFVDVDPVYNADRRVANLLSNSCTDSSHHYHTSRHQHRNEACKLHIPSSERESLYWKPYVRMSSLTVGTFSKFTFYDKLYYVEMSHHFIHVHDLYSKDLCLNPQGEPHMCPLHPGGDHGCLLLHIKARLIDKEGFSRAAVAVETTSRTATECSRWGETDFAHFQHSHTHTHTLVMTLHKENPSEDPHNPYYNFLTPRDPPEGLPCSPFST